jgi:hypothetical protein
LSIKQEGEEEQENNFVKEEVSDEYAENAEYASELQQKSNNNIESSGHKNNVSKKLFDSEQTTNLIFFKEVDDQEKAHQQHLSSINISPTTPVPDLDEQIQRANIIIQQSGNKGYYPCVYCNFETNIQTEYERHIVIKHTDHLACPTENDLRLNGGRFKRSRNS